MPNSKPATQNPFSRASTVEVSLVILLCSAIAGGAVWTTRTTIELTALRKAVEAGTVDRWAGRDMKTWVHLSNRETEAWTKDLERKLNLESDTLTPLRLPTLNFDD